MKKETQNPVYAHDTLEFVTVAAQYCAFLEQSEGRQREEFVDTMLKLLPLLYMKAQMIPTVDSEGTFLPDDQVTEQDYDWIRNTVYAIMQHDDEYEDLAYDEDMQTDESRWKSISEGLADTYQALRNFVSAYQQGIDDCMLASLWYVNENFELYWGQCVVDTLRRLHTIKYVLKTHVDEEDI